MKNNKLILFTLILSSLMICNSASAQNTTLGSEATSSNQSNTQMVGGWYPVFFDSYDQAQVDSIKKSISSGRVKRVVVSCIDNIQLADKIKAGIQSNLNFAVETSCESAPKDTGVTYKTDQVVVTVYTRKQ